MGEEHFKPLRHVLWKHTNQLPVIDRVLQQFEQGLPPRLRTILQNANSQADAVLNNHDSTSLMAQAALTVSDLQALRAELMRLPVNNQVRQVLSTIDHKLQQIEAHRLSVCNI